MSLLTDAFKTVRETHANQVGDVPLVIEWAQPVSNSTVFERTLVAPEEVAVNTIYETGLRKAYIPVPGNPNAKMENPEERFSGVMERVIKGNYSFFQSDKPGWKPRSHDRALLFSPENSDQEREIVCEALSTFSGQQVTWRDIKFEPYESYSYMAHSPTHRCRLWLDFFKQPVDDKLEKEVDKAKNESHYLNLCSTIANRIAFDPTIYFHGESTHLVQRLSQQLTQALVAARLSFNKEIWQSMLDEIVEQGKNRSIAVLHNKHYTKEFQGKGQRRIAPRIGSWVSQGEEQVYSPFAPQILVYPVPVPARGPQNRASADW